MKHLLHMNMDCSQTGTYPVFWTLLLTLDPRCCDPTPTTDEEGSQTEEVGTFTFVSAACVVHAS